MRKPLSLLSSLVLMIPLLAAGVLAAPSEEEAVRKAVVGFPDSWNRHDMEAFGRLFATDADFVNVAGAWVKGRQTIQSYHAYAHGTIPADTEGYGADRAYYGIFKTSTLQFTQIEVRFLRKDVAVAHARWEMLADARTPNPRRGLFTFVLTRQGGGWLIAAAQNTEIDRTVK